jgi:MoaA/NifB/PqqE/SkfB family radical SAM enzyme
LEQRYDVINIKSFPQILSVKLTNKCNARCKFCDVYSKEWELPSKVYEELLSLLDTLITVYWLGGEVFLYKQFKELFIKAKECNVRQEIITNGMLLTEEWMDDFISANVDLAISIRSIEKKRYEYLTEGASFDKLVSKLEYIKKQDYKRNDNFRLLMYVLVTKYNYMELDKFIEFAHKYKFNLVRFIQLDNMKDSPKSDNICNPRNEIYSELVEVFNRAIILANKYGIKIKNELPLNIQNEEIRKNEKISDFKSNPYAYKTDNYVVDIENISKMNNLFCRWPWEQFLIDVEGDIFFNCFCQKIFGTVKQSSILNLWNSKEVMDFRRKIINNDYKDVCNKMCVLDNVHRKNII